MKKLMVVMMLFTIGFTVQVDAASTKEKAEAIVVVIGVVDNLAACEVVCVRKSKGATPMCEQTELLQKGCNCSCTILDTVEAE